MTKNVISQTITYDTVEKLVNISEFYFNILPYVCNNERN